MHVSDLILISYPMPMASAQKIYLPSFEINKTERILLTKSHNFAVCYGMFQESEFGTTDIQNDLMSRQLSATLMGGENEESSRRGDLTPGKSEDDENQNKRTTSFSFH